MATEENVARADLPPQMALYEMAIGYYVSRALYLAAKLGIADRLRDGPRHFGELAEATGTHAPSLNRVLRLLASVGVFAEQEDGKFALTPLAEALRTDVPGSSHAMVQLFSGPRIQESWGDLEYCVQTGEPAFRKHGISDPFAAIARSPEDAARFDAAMADFTRLVAIAVAATYDFSPFRTVVDVGGGNGTLLIGILNSNPKLHGIVFDMPPAAERATKNISESGLADRCKAIGGDFFEDVPSGGDVYVLKHVIHDWNDDRAVKILANCRRAMPESGKLLIVEGVYPERINQSLDGRAAAANDVNMLVNTGGRQRSEEEFRSLYDAAGFELTRIVSTPARISVVEGARK
jgi:SAM-dependent methyltransferase